MRTFTVGTISFFTLMVGSCVSFSSHQTLNNTQRRNKEALALKQSSNGNSNQLDDRRNFLNSCGAVLIFGASAIMPEKAEAKQPDCMSDCLKECKVIAPKDPAYCLQNCKSYCEQENRTDGLSGSVSSEGGEMGILGTSTVVKGEDKPPSLSIPGLDFSSDKGRKLLGY